VAGRGYRTEAVVLRSLRLGEADCVLHLYTLARGRIGAVAKGVRRTRSRFGARLEPLSHIDLSLHQGGGELHTVTGADLVRSHRAAREDLYRLHVGLIGLEAMLRLFSEQEANPKAFEALTRFLDALDEHSGEPASRPSLDPLALSFQLKLLWLSGYLPHLRTCVECGSEGPLAGYSPQAGGAVCPACGEGSLALSPEGLAAMHELLGRPLVEAGAVTRSERAARDCLAVISSSYEYHGGFRLRTLAAG
jgi:DNA repair protein RecO (recombination protein O)